MKYKKYIRIDKDKKIIRAFCEVHEKPLKDDILVEESTERHYNLDLYDDYGNYKYEWKNNEITERQLTQEELDKIEKEKKIIKIRSKLPEIIYDMIEKNSTKSIKDEIASIL